MTTDELAAIEKPWETDEWKALPGHWQRMVEWKQCSCGTWTDASYLPDCRREHDQRDG